MDWDIVWSILKWVLLVFLAGFIGYFGRYLSQALIARRRRESSPSANGGSDIQDDSRDKIRAKIDKKRAKARLKQIKKGRR